MKRLTTKLFAVVCGCLMSTGAWGGVPLEQFETLNVTSDVIYIGVSAFNDCLAQKVAAYQNAADGTFSGSSKSFSMTPEDSEVPNLTANEQQPELKTPSSSNGWTAGRQIVFKVTGVSETTIWGFSDISKEFEIVASTDGSTIAASATYAVTTKGGNKCTLSGLNPSETYYISYRAKVASVYCHAIKFTAGVQTPSIKSFTAEGVAATIANDTISAELPYGTDLTSITPTVTLGGSAKGYSPTGAQDFSNSATAGSAVEYIVSDSATSPTTKTYKVILTAATTASSEKTLSDVTIGGESVELTGNAGSIVLSKSADLSALAVTFEIPATAGADFTSGSTFDFTSNSLTITVQAQDGSTAVYTLSASKGTKDILYLTISSAEDLFLNQLKAKGYYVITRAGQSTAPANYDGIDLVVLHESLSGSDGSGTTKELALIKDVDVPILNTKSYFYTAGSSPRWGWGTANNGNSQTYVTLNTAVYSNVASHPIFAGLTIDKDTTIILGTETAKNIQPIASFESGYEGYSLATVPAGCAIHELPATARLASGTSKYLLVSILSSKFNNLTANGLTLLDNACNYLMGSDVWTPVLVSTSLAETSIWGVSYVNGIIRNSNGVALLVYNATGKLVATGMENIDMNGFAAGVYVVRSNSGALKIVK